VTTGRACGSVHPYLGSLPQCFPNISPNISLPAPTPALGNISADYQTKRVWHTALPFCTVRCKRQPVAPPQGECPEELEPEIPNTPINVNLVRKEEDYAEPEKPR
jgi:hypothetical protein